MIYPFEPFKVDQDFGNPTSYGPHEGVDLNVKATSGNQDCGTELHAIADGEIVHYSESTKDYGKLVILYLKGAFGERYIRYCHCDEVLVKSGLVKRGDTIAKMGSTGNSTACHLHFDMLKKRPTRWRFYAKTREELDEWFDNPLEFIEKWKQEDMPNWLKELLRLDLNLDISTDEGIVRARVGEIKSNLTSYADTKKRLKTLEEDYTVVSGDLEKKKEEFRLSEEDRTRLAQEKKEIEENVVKKDIQINGLLEEKLKLEKKLQALQTTSEPKHKNLLDRILEFFKK